MKKWLLLFVLIGGFIYKSDAQPPDYDDLVIYYADGDYEKLLKKAEKYTLDDKTKSDPIPYLYLAKANFEMSKDQSWLEKYPKAFNDAIRYAGNCVKKDKEGIVFAENVAFFSDLKIAMVEEIKNLIVEGGYAKLMGTIAKLHKFAPDDIGSYFLKAAAQYQTKDKSGARITAKEAYDRLDQVTSVDGWQRIDLEMLKVGVIEYCKAIIVINMVQEAKDLLGRVKQWLEFDTDFMSYYDCVVNNTGC